MCRSLYFDKFTCPRPATLSKKATSTQVFSCKFNEFFRTPLFQNTSEQLLLNFANKNKASENEVSNRWFYIFWSFIYKSCCIVRNIRKPALLNHVSGWKYAFVVRVIVGGSTTFVWDSSLVVWDSSVVVCSLLWLVCSLLWLVCSLLWLVCSHLLLVCDSSVVVCDSSVTCL